MKKVNLEPMIEFLPTYMVDAIFAVAKIYGKDVDKLDLYRTGHCEKAATNQLDDGSRAAIKYVSTRTLDRDKEIVLPRGVDISEFQKYMHVLVNHNYNLPPIGSDEWIKADDFGVKAKTIYADTGEGTMANIMWHLVRQGHQRASSIGFVPVAWTEPGHNDWDKVTTELRGVWPEYGAKEKKETKRIITKAMLLEHSDVSVPANTDAEVIAVAKSFGADDKILKQLGWARLAALEGNEKAVIPYKDLGVAPEDAAWNGPQEISAAEVDDLKLMASWYDSENADMKGAYKLPHHKAAGGHVAVWAGVRSAMGVLLGARGGVEIPAGDRQGVYNHLAKHYRQWEKEPPEFRDYETGELKTLFPEFYQPVIVRAIRPVERIIRVISEPSMPTAADIAREAVKEILDKKRGVLR